MKFLAGKRRCQWPSGGKRKIIVKDVEAEEEHLVPMNKHVIVSKSDLVKKGQQLAEGPVAPSPQDCRRPKASHLRPSSFQPSTYPLQTANLPAMSIATKTGDKGTTALMYGRRVSKTDPRVCAYGTVDELNAALGTVRAAAGDAFVTQAVLSIQKELVILMGELAVAPEDRERYREAGYHFVDAAMVDRLTAIIHDLEKNHHINYHGWATPGATAGSAALDVARTTCRRAEREVVALSETGAEVNAEIIRYLNRLSDLCWLWARWVETRADGTNPESGLQT